jgi:uncharacterized protein (DUF342 family)
MARVKIETGAGSMTVDERLDRLTEPMEKLEERHQALTQSLESLAGMQRENDRRWAKTDGRFAETLQFINQLARIAETHEHRLDHLEGQ